MSFIQPLGTTGMQRLRRIEYQVQGLLWKQMHCAMLALGGGGEAIADRAYLSELAWAAIAERLAGGSVDDMPQITLNPGDLPLNGADLSDDAPMYDEILDGIACSLEGLQDYACRRLDELGVAPTPEILASAMINIARVRAVAAGMMRHQYCAHIEHRPPTAMMVLLLDPAVNPRLSADETASAALQALLPAATINERRDPASPLLLAPAGLSAERISALRPRILREGARDLPTYTTSQRGHTSRHATMSCAEAVNAMAADSPHMRQLNFDGPKQGVSWSPVTRAHFDATMKLVSKHFGDCPLATLQVADWGGFFAILDRLPANHHRSKFDADRSLEEICERGQEEVASGHLSADKIGLGAASINRHVSSLRTLFAWLGQYVEVPSIPWARFCRPLPRTTRDRGYTREEAAQIFELAPYTGRKMPAGPLTAGDTVWHNAAYWVFLLLIYSGARLAEVCGLLATDIKRSHGIWYMALVENDSRALKRVASIRDVPLHPEIIRLGFLDFVDAIKAEGESMLFPELRSPTGRPIALGFRELNAVFFERELPFMGEGRSAHPVRHLVNDLLKLAEVSLEDRQLLLGQEGEKREKRVASLNALKRAHAAVERIPSFTDHLRPAPVLLHPKDRRTRRTRRSASLSSSEE